MPSRVGPPSVASPDYATKATVKQQSSKSATQSNVMAEDLFEKLVTIFRDRDIPYDRDAIKSALKDPGSQTAIREWMQEYLCPETLLTKEEATLYVRKHTNNL